MTLKSASAIFDEQPGDRLGRALALDDVFRSMVCTNPTLPAPIIAAGARQAFLGVEDGSQLIALVAVATLPETPASEPDQISSPERM